MNSLNQGRPERISTEIMSGTAGIMALSDKCQSTGTVLIRGFCQSLVDILASLRVAFTFSWILLP